MCIKRTLEVKALHPWDNISGQQGSEKLSKLWHAGLLKTIQAFGELANLIEIGNSNTLKNNSIKLYDLLKLSNSSLLIHTQ